MNEDTYTFAVGELRCTVVFDSILRAAADLVFPPEHEDRWPSLDLGPDRRIRTPVFCLLIEQGNQLVLVDGGNGERLDRPEETQGRLLTQLGRMGIRRDDVKVVVMTHAHLDHVGGLVTRAADREVTFPGARHVLAEADWDYVGTPREHDPAPIAAQAASAHRILTMLREAGSLELVAAGADVVPGIRMLDAPGHTPGNSVVVAESGRETLVFLGDTFHHPGQIDKPDLVSPVDHDRDLVPRSRRAIIEFAMKRQAIVAASHFAFPSVGHVGGTRARPVYQPIAAATGPAL